MKTDPNKIVFINRSGQRIVVEDQASASALEQALNQYQNNEWVRAEAVASSRVAREYISSKQLRVIVVCGRSSFRSTSSRLSLHSMQLKTKVPSSFLGLECTAYVIHPDLNDRIEVACTVTSDQNGESVLDFNLTDTSEIKRLESWI